MELFDLEVLQFCNTVEALQVYDWPLIPVQAEFTSDVDDAENLTSKINFINVEKYLSYSVQLRMFVHMLAHLIAMAKKCSLPLGILSHIIRNRPRRIKLWPLNSLQKYAL